MDGYLLIDKPMGWTSFDVVAKVRSALSKEWRETHGKRRKIKVGHTGTLDPMATGLMVVVVGKYTKRSQELTKLDKVYEVEITLGANSSTGDSEGDLTPVSSHEPTRLEIEQSIDTFTGDIMQTPPVYSAIKISGQRAYKLAREGKEVKMEPRQVSVYEITNINDDYPVVSFTAHVSSGTYIRSLAEDIGSSLGTGAHMTSLRRTAVGGFELSISSSLEGLSSKDLLSLD